ncbi:MAG: phosphoribosyltransferase family protein [Haloferacaceae archaeon]
MTGDEEFDCTVTNWEYIYGLTRDVAEAVRDAEFEPDVIVALARGGWFAGRCLCDFLGLDDLTSLKIEHYVGTAAASGEAEIRYPMPDGSVEGKRVLVVDDITDTGESLRRAETYVRDRDPAAVRTATLQQAGESAADPDFVGERLAEWTWVVYPWNFIEDMCDLIGSATADADAAWFTPDEVRSLLAERHGIERIELEVAQPGRLEEVLAEMERRGLIERDGERLRPTAEAT